MANDFDTALRNLASKAADYVNDAATLTVESKYVHIGGGEDESLDKARALAKTVIKLDGDSEVIFPLQKNEDGQLELDGVLFDMHAQNVQTAIEYRARMLDALLAALPAARRR